MQAQSQGSVIHDSAASLRKKGSGPYQVPYAGGKVSLGPGRGRLELGDGDGRVLLAGLCPATLSSRVLTRGPSLHPQGTG